jgi:DNA polymerase III epsilon subunit-like protein
MTDKPYMKKYEEDYKNVFTKHALNFLSSQVHWKFIKREKEQHFYYDEPENDTYEHAPDTEILDFDIENKFHRDEVVRVCFGPHILSTGIVQFDINGTDMDITEDPYYEEFRQTPHYVHSTHVQQIHHLTATQLRRSRHDITSLHEKLKTILETSKNLKFVAHNAQQDRKWILQSIDDQILYHQYLSCKSGDDQGVYITNLTDLRDRLKNACHYIENKTRTWFCTLNGSMKDDGTSLRRNNGAKAKIKTEEYTLDALYQTITGAHLPNHHNALTDTYACALIFCELLKISYPQHNLTQSHDYKRIREISDSPVRERPAKRNRTLTEVGRSNAGPFSGDTVDIRRQYDIYTDDRKLPASFVYDADTQVGKLINLEFGGGLEHDDNDHYNRVGLTDTLGNPSRYHYLSNSEFLECGNLGGICITFVLKDDRDGRRVEIYSYSNYLDWIDPDSIDSDTGIFVSFPLHPATKRLDWDKVYKFREAMTGEEIGLEVRDLHPRPITPLTPIEVHTAPQLQPIRRLLLNLKSFCM